MDTWKFFDVTHRDHVICNPMSLARIDELISLLDLPSRPRVLDVASGKGEFLLRLAERYGGPAGAGFSGVAIDISPYVVAELRRGAGARAPGASIEILEQDASAYQPAAASFDLGCCIGASWIYGGHAGTLSALAAAVRPGGQVLVGEPFWRRDPDEGYLTEAGLRRDEFGTHAENVATGERAGLVPLLALVSSGEEWDRYETLQWRATARWVASHPEDPDIPELVERVAQARHAYLTWGRDTLGWALYLFARPVR